MTTNTRSPREELLSSLTQGELEQFQPLSEQTIRTAVQRGQDEAEAARTTEQLPMVAQTLRYQ